MSARALRMAAAVRTRLRFDGPQASPAMLVACAPVDVLSLDWPLELSGVLLVKSKRAFIGLNRHHSSPRRHFSFWHEVGHYLLHAPRGLMRCASAPAWGRFHTLEREANLFASRLTMPEDWVLRLLPESATLTALARRFHVTPSAMERRLREVGRSFRTPAAALSSHGCPLS